MKWGWTSANYNKGRRVLFHYGLAIARGDCALRARDWARSPCATRHCHENILRMPHRVRRRPEYECVPRVSRNARRAAGVEPQGCGTGNQGGAGAELFDPRAIALRAQE